MFLQNLIDRFRLWGSPYPLIVYLDVALPLSGTVVSQYHNSPGYLISEIHRISGMPADEYMLFSDGDTRVEICAKSLEAVERARTVLRSHGVETVIRRVAQ